jgi:hypothetical protein
MEKRMMKRMRKNKKQMERFHLQSGLGHLQIPCLILFYFPQKILKRRLLSLKGEMQTSLADRILLRQSHLTASAVLQTTMKWLLATAKDVQENGFIMRVLG